MCSGRSVPPLKQGLCWKVLVEALLGLCGLQVPTRWFTENKNTHLYMMIAPTLRRSNFHISITLVRDSEQWTK